MLQENYVQFWGLIYLPGKVIQADDTEMIIMLPGAYRLISGVAVTVDGKVITLEESVYLEVRNYSVTMSDRSTLMLDAPIPQTPPPERNVFGGF